MSDLISREKLTFNISEALSHTPPELMHTSIVVERILNAIEEEEAVDAVPIVTRCKYCKHGDKSAYGIACGITGCLKDPNGFCDDGDPKEDTCE